MVVGDYTFVLKVTDRGGQTATSSVTVVVQPEKNAPPVAKAGSDKVSKKESVAVHRYCSL